MKIDQILARLRPGVQWSATRDDYESLVMADKPSLDEMAEVQKQIDAERAACESIRLKLRGVLATFSAGESVAYTRAIRSVSEQLDMGDSAAAKAIISTYPSVDNDLRNKLLSCF